MVFPLASVIGVSMHFRFQFSFPVFVFPFSAFPYGLALTLEILVSHFYLLALTTYKYSISFLELVKRISSSICIAA